MRQPGDFAVIITILSIATVFCYGLYVQGYFPIQKLQTTETPRSELVTDSPTPTATPDPIRISFVGDIMLDRYIRRKALENGGYDFILSDLTDTLHSSDVVVGNLEGPVTTFDSVSIDSEVGSTRNFLFTFAPQSLQVLKTNNITLLNVGNNHILNFGLDGLAQTYQFLEQEQFVYFGNAGQGADTPQRYVVQRFGELDIAFVNYNQFVEDGWEAALADLQAATASADLQIVYTHWGNEYVQENQFSINQAHTFVDRGADLVIGSHPHVIQGTEDYNGARIYYSLGNFIFDQYFQPAVREGLVVTVEIDPQTHSLYFKEQRVSLQPSGQTTILPAVSPL